MPSLNILRKPALAAVLATLALGLAACESDTAGPEAGADVGDLQADVAAFEERFTALEERVGAIEEEAVAPDDPADGELADDEVMADVDSFVGETVTVSSEVEETLGTNAFTLSGPQGPLLVTSATGMGDNEIVEPDAPVQVTGTVRENFTVTGFEDEFGVDLDDELFADFEQQTYIVADSISEPPAE